MVYVVAMGYKGILPVIAPNTGTNSKIMLNIYICSVSKHRNGTVKILQKHKTDSTSSGTPTICHKIAQWCV